MYPENDELCASIISEVIAKTKTKTNDDSRAASSSVDITRDRNQVYALRLKMFGRYLPHSYPCNKTESRSASLISMSDTIPNVHGPNKVYELRQVMFGSYSK